MTTSALQRDEWDRARIEEDLASNLMVEAGAGSGKTTALVGRMVALVASGVPVEAIAAVTFTRKAAGELRERFETRLEAAATTEPDPERRERFAVARARLDRAFLGTIHSFCGRLLREHPLEAGVDPGFTEVREDRWPLLMATFWREWLEKERAAGSDLLAGVEAVGIAPQRLFDAFRQRCTYPDVRFPAPPQPMPAVEACRATLREMMRRAAAVMPAEEPSPTWDDLQRSVRRLLRLDRTTDWDNPHHFCAALNGVKVAVVQKRWLDKAAAKGFISEWESFMAVTAEPLLRAWRQHRYAPVMALLAAAAKAFERQRLVRGELNFEDLLTGAATLLRESPAARRALGERYRHLLVDEFQDTDPIQAEVCLLLASDPAEGNDWRTVAPRPGALFIVGDPRQSIYRFRRADIETYVQVKRRIEATGAVLHLTRNFRSVHAIGDFVNAHFVTTFAPEGGATAEQAAFAPLLTGRATALEPGVAVAPLVIPQGASAAWEAVVAEEAPRIASWIARRVAAGEPPGCFMVLTPLKAELDQYARALAERNVPVDVSGAGLTAEEELAELLIVLRALADPANPVLVAAALEGLCFGLAPVDLLHGRRAGLRFDLTEPPQEVTGPATRVAAALARLRAWWQAASALAPDLLVERLLDDTGLLEWSAASELGDNRAGAITHVIEALRVDADDEPAGVARAVEVIEAALADTDVGATLRPGRENAVRVMNLHKAKGLEADIVVLAGPKQPGDRTLTVHVERQGDGGAVGSLLVCDGKLAIAEPVDWDAKAAAERRFLDAEQERLRYVATTRAREQLVISRLDNIILTGRKPDLSLWGPLTEAATDLPAEEMPVVPAEGRRGLDASAEALAADARDVEHRREAAARSSWLHRTVTRSLAEERGEIQEVGPVHAAGRGGKAWGNAVHAMIEAMGRGREGTSLARFAAAAAREFELGEHGADRLLRLAAQVRGSATWRELMAAPERGFELTMARVAASDGVRCIVEGMADAAMRTPDGWTVVDWKSDRATDQRWEERIGGYQRQVAAYAEAVAARTGAPARGIIERIREEE